MFIKKGLFVLFGKKGLFVLSMKEKGLFSSTGNCNDKRLLICMSSFVHFFFYLSCKTCVWLILKVFIY